MSRRSTPERVMDHPSITTAVFDLGGVLIDWNPRYLYRRLFDDDESMERFLSTIATPQWNLAQDAGRPWAEAVEELSRQHPQHHDLIEAYWRRWPETLGPAIESTVDIVDQLRTSDVRLFGLSNFSAETFPFARQRFPFLEWFDGIVISGDEGVIKPDPRIFRVLTDRYGIVAQESVFVDDQPANVEAAATLGFHALVFSGADKLREDLRLLGML